MIEGVAIFIVCFWGLVFLVALACADVTIASEFLGAILPKPGRAKRNRDLAAQEARVTELLIYCNRLGRERVSETRQGIRDEYLKVARERLAQEETKLEAMRIEEDEKEFEEMV